MNIRDFAEFTLDYFSSILLTDIEESVLKGKPTINNEMVKEWLAWLEENRDTFADDTFHLVLKQFVNDLGAMPIWFGDEKFQESVLEGFKRYFQESSYFLDFFTTAYLRGLEEDGLR
ncbi:hypothetical protein [Mesobacillus foraminis]|uniref:hypothetical protein n=1 Tax=Mesobacillus foraminis TaxID=279826 RepID=UPI000EF47C67|nr:hypothetical protein [Mesobacillus foraminis]